MKTLLKYGAALVGVATLALVVFTAANTPARGVDAYEETTSETYPDWTPTLKTLKWGINIPGILISSQANEVVRTRTGFLTGRATEDENVLALEVSIETAESPQMPDAVDKVEYFYEWYKRIHMPDGGEGTWHQSVKISAERRFFLHADKTRNHKAKVTRRLKDGVVLPNGESVKWTNATTSTWLRYSDYVNVKNKMKLPLEEARADIATLNATITAKNKTIAARDKALKELCDSLIGTAFFNAEHCATTTSGD